MHAAFRNTCTVHWSSPLSGALAQYAEKVWVRWLQGIEGALPGTHVQQAEVTQFHSGPDKARQALQSISATFGMAFMPRMLIPLMNGKGVKGLGASLFMRRRQLCLQHQQFRMEKAHFFLFLQ